MSDLMLLGILRMPVSDNPKELSATEWVQIKSAMREAATRIETDADALEAQAKEIADSKEWAAKVEDANDWLIERNRTLDARIAELEATIIAATVILGTGGSPSWDKIEDAYNVLTAAVSSAALKGEKE